MSSQRATAVRKKGGSQTANAVSSRNYRQKKKAIQDEVTIKLKQYEQENYAVGLGGYYAGDVEGEWGLCYYLAE